MPTTTAKRIKRGPGAAECARVVGLSAALDQLDTDDEHRKDDEALMRQAGAACEAVVSIADALRARLGEENPPTPLEKP